MRISDIKNKKYLFWGDFSTGEIIQDIKDSNVGPSHCLILFKDKKQLRDFIKESKWNQNIKKISEQSIYMKDGKTIFLWTFSKRNNDALFGCAFEYICGININLDFSCDWHNMYLVVNRTERNKETSFKLFLNGDSHPLLNIANFKEQNVFEELHFAKNK